jgi:hypothetical protein
MPFEAREAFKRRPSPVSIHDDGNMTRKILRVDLGGETAE